MCTCGSIILLAMFTGAEVENASKSPIDDILKLLEGSEAARKNLEVTTEYTKLQKEFLPVRTPFKTTLVAHAIVDAAGRAWYDARGEQIRMGPEPNQIGVYRGRWQASHDGKVARFLYGDRHGEFHRASIDQHLSWHGISPREFTTHFQDQPISQVLRTKNGTRTGETVWENRPVVILETRPNRLENLEQRKYIFWVDLPRAIVVRRSIAVQYGEKLPWREYARIVGRDHREVAPGIWLPHHVLYESLNVSKGKSGEQLSWSHEGKNRDWKVNQELPPHTFHLSFPAHLPVDDRTK